MTKSPGLCAVISTLMLLSLSGCASQSTRAGERARLKPVAVRSAAPDFEAKDASGRSFHLADYKGKVVVLDFWATWCGPCKIEVPWFIEFERTYKDQGFAVVGISLDDDGWEVVKPFIEARKMNYRVALGNPQIEQLFGGGSGVESLPLTFIIDRSGKVASRHIGLASKDEFRNEIEELLH